MSADNPGMPLDWSVIRRQVEAARQAIARGWEPSPEEKRRILHERAKQLAVETAEAAVEGTAPLGVLAFRLADETYGIELPFVREVFPLRSFTPLPCTPPFVLGLANVRGQILSIVDLRKLFELPEMAITEQSRLIVLHREGMELSIVTDAVLDVRAVRPEELQSTLPTVAGIHGSYCKGVTADRLILFDAKRFLSDKEIIVDEHVEG